MKYEAVKQLQNIKFKDVEFGEEFAYNSDLSIWYKKMGHFSCFGDMLNSSKVYGESPARFLYFKDNDNILVNRPIKIKLGDIKPFDLFVFAETGSVFIGTIEGYSVFDFNGKTPENRDYQFCYSTPKDIFVTLVKKYDEIIGE